MRMNGDIADKLNRPDLMTLDLSFDNRPDVSFPTFFVVLCFVYVDIFLSGFLFVEGGLLGKNTFKLNNKSTHVSPYNSRLRLPRRRHCFSSMI